MQKKVIALAVAGLMSGAAFAQSNVTIYGKVDVAYLNARGGGKLSAIDSGAHDNSRIGFKGEEALGNGLKAVFALEYQVSADQNDGLGAMATQGTHARQQYVGLQGEFGEVLVGRLYAPQGDTFAYDSMDGTDAFSVYGSLGGWPNDRTNNSIGYTSPTFGGGFSVKANYGFGQQAGSETAVGGTVDKDERNKSLGLYYNNGPVSLGYMVQRKSDIGTTLDGFASASRTSQFLGGSYDFGTFALMAARTSVDNNTAAGGNDHVTWTLGGTVPVSANGLVRVQYARLNADGDNTDARGWGIQYDHNLSKRTMIYGGYSRISNDSNQNQGVYFGSTGPGLGDSSRIYGLGIRHNF